MIIIHIILSLFDNSGWFYTTFYGMVWYRVPCRAFFHFSVVVIYYPIELNFYLLLLPLFWFGFASYRIVSYSFVLHRLA